MIIKIVTDCGFAGCEQTHLVEVPDTITEEEIAALVDQMVQDDIQPTGSWEQLSDEEVEEEIENGYDIE